MEGLLLVNKPKGWTSFDVVNYIRKIIAVDLGIHTKKIKVGHIGTLDPLATGLLVLLIGKEYTVKAPQLTKLDKIYEVELQLGVTSPSMDSETDMKTVSDKKPSADELLAALGKFKGKIKQVPPAFSAIKVNAQRSYDLARKGQSVELASREVEIYKIELISYKYPVVKLLTHVSSGTYIRSLASDLGKNLGTGAVMTALVRTKINGFNLKDSLAIEGLNAKTIKQNLKTV